MCINLAKSNIFYLQLLHSFHPSYTSLYFSTPFFSLAAIPYAHREFRLFPKVSDFFTQPAHRMRMDEPGLRGAAEGFRRD